MDGAPRKPPSVADARARVLGCLKRVLAAGGNGGAATAEDVLAAVQLAVGKTREEAVGYLLMHTPEEVGGDAGRPSAAHMAAGETPPRTAGGACAGAATSCLRLPPAVPKFLKSATPRSPPEEAVFAHADVEPDVLWGSSGAPDADGTAPGGMPPHAALAALPARERCVAMIGGTQHTLPHRTLKRKAGAADGDDAGAVDTGAAGVVAAHLLGGGKRVKQVGAPGMAAAAEEEEEGGDTDVSQMFAKSMFLK